MQKSLLIVLRRCRCLVPCSAVFLVLFCTTGCASFFWQHGMKDYVPDLKPDAAGIRHPTHYQEDFLYLKTLGEEVFPLEDKYFPPDKRAALEQEALRELGKPDCSNETFVMAIRRYLAEFNNQHANIGYNPKPVRYAAFYPFTVHYFSNELYLADTITEFDDSLIGQKIVRINDQPVVNVEEKLGAINGAENAWSKRMALEPAGFSRPDLYRVAGLAASATNRLKLEFADHDPIEIEPRFRGKLKWRGQEPPPHPITSRSKHLYDCQVYPGSNYAYLQFNACFDRVAVKDGVKSYVKPWMRPLVHLYLDIQFLLKRAGPLEDVYDPQRPVFSKYLDSAIQDLNQRGITNLILDLRYNSGGERELCKQLIYHLSRNDQLRDARLFPYNLKVYASYDPDGYREFLTWYREKFDAEPQDRQLQSTPDQELPFFDCVIDSKSPYYVSPDRPVFNGRIFVLVNEDTASAASELAALIQDNHLGVLIGTFTSNNATGPTSFTPFKLPHSKIMVSLPTDYNERALPSNGDALVPDYWVENSLADIQEGRDAAFEKALELLKE